MELTKEQIQEIDTYVSSCGVKYYDVKAEIVDHFATVLELQLEESPKLNFKQEIINVHRKFSDRGFYNLLERKTKAVHKKFYRSSLKHLLSFFKLPKVIVSIALFLGLKEVMKLFTDKEDFFQLLSGIGILIVFAIYIKEFSRRRKQKESFLALQKNDSFLQVINMMSVLFNSSITFRSNSGFENELYNSIHIGVFILFMLFYFSGEYVFRQNKKMILEQYPNVIV